MGTYTVRVGRETRLTFEGRFAEASCPITIEGDSTPFQVADARHSPFRAAAMLRDWLQGQSGDAPFSEDEDPVLVDEDGEDMGTVYAD